VVDLDMDLEEAGELAAENVGGLMGLNRGEVDEEAIWRSIDAADSSSGVSVSGVGGDDDGGLTVNDPEKVAGDFPKDLDDLEEDEEVAPEEVAPGPKLSKGGTCVDVYVRMGSKQWVVGGGDGRYEEEFEEAAALSRGE